MKLSFSTRGWPGLTWEEMMDTALDMGFAGIEVYNLQKFDPLLDKGGPFHKYQAAATARQLREKQLTIPCLDTSCDISSDTGAITTVLELLEVAQNTHIPYLDESPELTLLNPGSIGRHRPSYATILLRPDSYHCQLHTM